VLSAAFRDRAVYLPDADALVVADVHAGRAGASRVSFPLGERSSLRERLAARLADHDPAEVVVAGDLLHAFGTPTDRAVGTVRALADACREAGAEPVAVRGNHDAALDRAWPGEVCERRRLDDGTLVCHGHERPGEAAPLYVVGHGHPAIEIEGLRRPCYLYGERAHRGGDLLVLPAFTPLAPGATVNGMDAAAFDSPLVTDAETLRPVVRDDDAGETLSFPPLGELGRFL
jgi:metallophosphoesterase superfamily enzyme